MNRLLFFTSEFVSHIIPIIPLIELLTEKNEIFCVATKENKNILEETGARVLFYPDDYFEKVTSSSKESLISKTEKELQENFSVLMKGYEKESEFSDIMESFIYNKIKLEAIKLYNYKPQNLIYIEKTIKWIKPNLVFRDSLDFFSSEIVRKHDISCIGILTNNMYNFDYLNSSKRDLYSSFLRLRFNEMFFADSFFDNLEEHIKEIYIDIAKELDMPALPPFPNYNLNEEKNLIFALPSLHPNYEFLKRKKGEYFFLHPTISNYEIEDEEIVEDTLKQFVNKSTKKIAYIATGSFAQKESNFYSRWINALYENDYNVIVSLKNGERLETRDNNMKLYISSELPQKYVLSKSSLFISAGGANSIYEAIHFEVPMIITPISAEQILTGMLLENYHIARTIEHQGEVNTQEELVIKEIEYDFSRIKEKMRSLKKDFWNRDNLKSEIKNYFDSINL